MLSVLAGSTYDFQSNESIARRKLVASGVMMTAKEADDALAARMFDALNSLERRLRRSIALDEMGRMVAEAEGRPDDPYAPSVVSRWLRGVSEPRQRATWRALAQVLGVSAGWLAFGDEGSAPAEGAPENEERPPVVRKPLPMRKVDVDSPRPPARRKRPG